MINGRCASFLGSFCTGWRLKNALYPVEGAFDIADNLALRRWRALNHHHWQAKLAGGEDLAVGGCTAAVL